MKKITCILNGKIELAELVEHMRKEHNKAEDSLEFNRFGKLILTEGVIAGDKKFEITLNLINGNISRYIDNIKVGKSSIFEFIDYETMRGPKENLIAEVADIILDHARWRDFYYLDDGQCYKEDVFLFAHVTSDTDADFFATIMDFMFEELVASNLEYDGVEDKHISRLRNGVAQLANM